MLLETHARELAGASEKWSAYEYQCLPPGGETKCYRLKGAVAPLKKSGKAHDWRKKDKATVKEVWITVVEHQEWLKAWEKKTGKCTNCEGEGKTLASASIHGCTYRECSQCKGTGKAKV